MSTFIPKELTFALFVLAIIGVFVRHDADRRHLRKLRNEATDAIKSLLVESNNPRLRLDGATATLERREETGGVRGIFEKIADFDVKVYLRNEFGERFLVMWHSKSAQRPFVKHLPGSVNASCEWKPVYGQPTHEA